MPGPFTEIREALFRWGKALESDETSVWDAAVAALERVEREAAERETALKSTILDAGEIITRVRKRAERAEARVREVEAERGKLKDATSGLANAAESFIHSFSGHIGESYFTADTLTRSIARARAVLASPEAAAAEPPMFVCPRGHEHFEGSAFCTVCGAGPVLAAALPAADTGADKT